MVTPLIFGHLFRDPTKHSTVTRPKPIDGVHLQIDRGHQVLRAPSHSAPLAGLYRFGHAWMSQEDSKWLVNGL